MGGGPGGFRSSGPGPGPGPGSGGGGGFGRGQGGERRGDRGGPGGGEPGAAGRRPRGERQMARTVYILPAKKEGQRAEELKPQPVQVKVGISDGVSTEVLEGLEEGLQVVTGMISTGGAEAARPANPFGGGFRRF